MSLSEEQISVIDPRLSELWIEHSYLPFFYLQNMASGKYLRILTYFLGTETLWIITVHFELSLWKVRRNQIKSFTAGSSLLEYLYGYHLQGWAAPFLFLSTVLELRWIHFIPREGPAEFLFDDQPDNLYLWVWKNSKTELMLQMLLRAFCFISLPIYYHQLPWGDRKSKNPSLIPIVLALSKVKEKTMELQMEQNVL